MKWPFKTPIMLKKTHTEIMADARAYHLTEIRSLEGKQKKEIEFIAKNLHDAISRLSKVGVVYDHTEMGERYRVVIDLEPELMCRALERGNDDWMIERIGEQFKRSVINKLTLFNMQRPEDRRMGRG